MKQLRDGKNGHFWNRRLAPDGLTPSTIGMSAFALLALCLLLPLTGCELDLDDDDPASVDNTTPLSLEPGSITISASAPTNVSFTVSGGVPTYSWTLTDTSLGSIAPNGGTAIYSSLSVTGQTFVIVTDALTNAITAVITQQ